MNNRSFKALMLASALILTACGGGGDNTPASGESGSQPDTSQSVGTGVLKPNAFVLSSQDLTGATITDTALTVRKPQSIIRSRGDVLIVDAFGGRLIRITAVLDGGDTITYQYEPAALADAFSELDVAINGNFTAEELGPVVDTGDPELEIGITDVTGGQVSPNSARLQAQNVAVSYNQVTVTYKRLGFSSGSGIEIGGSSTFTLNPDFSLKLYTAQGDTIPTLDMSAVLRPDLRTTVNIGSSYGGQVSYTFDKSFPLKPIRRVIIVPVAGIPVPVPFWITPQITVAAAINGTAGSKFNTAYSYGVSGALGFTQQQGVFDPIPDTSTSSSISFSDVESELGVNLTAPKIEATLLIYSFAGPAVDIGAETGIVGKGATRGSPPEEGVEVTGSIKAVANVGLKAGLDFGSIDAVKSLLGNVKFEYAPVSVKVLDLTLGEKTEFFPYKGVAAIVVNDNGSAPDDIFQISLDGVVIGRTNKGGSGQFRLKNLKPGERTLTITTVEDDFPPGTYEVTLADGLTFASGGTYRSGNINLGQSLSLTVVVPPPQPAP